MTVSCGDFVRLEKNPNRLCDLAGLELEGLGSLIEVLTVVGACGGGGFFCRDVPRTWGCGIGAVVRLGEGNLEGFLEEVEALDEERPMAGRGTTGLFVLVEGFTAAFSMDSRRVCPVVAKLLRLLCIIGESFLGSSSSGVSSRLGLGGGPFFRLCDIVESFEPDD